MHIKNLHQETGPEGGGRPSERSVLKSLQACGESRPVCEEGGGGLIGSEGKGIEGFVGQEEDFVGDTELDLEPVKMDEVWIMCCHGWWEAW